MLPDIEAFVELQDVLGLIGPITIDDKEIDPELAREIMEAIQQAQSQAEDKLKEVPNTPKRVLTEKPPKSTKKVIASKENDDPKEGEHLIFLSCGESLFCCLISLLFRSQTLSTPRTRSL